MGENSTKCSCKLQNYSLECQHEDDVAVPSYPTKLAKTVQFFLFLPYTIFFLNDLYLSSIISISCETYEHLHSSTYDSKLSIVFIESCTLSFVKKKFTSRHSRAATIAES